MNDGAFRSIDSEKLLAGEDFYGGEVSVPDGGEPKLMGIIKDSKIGRYRVRFLCLLPPDGIGPPVGLTIWKPDRPTKGLKGALLKKYRHERREHIAECARAFGLAFTIIDRTDGGPRITERVFEDGTVEPVSPPAPYLPAVH
jgi:hypothetical protein